MKTNNNQVAACFVPEILVRLLGGTMDEWDTFITENQAGWECEPEIPFTKNKVGVFYELSDIYLSIRLFPRP